MPQLRARVAAVPVSGSKCGDVTAMYFFLAVLWYRDVMIRPIGPAPDPIQARQTFPMSELRLLEQGK